jgi:hypothetical protein
MAFVEDAADFIDDFASAATLQGASVSVVMDKSTFFQLGIETSMPIATGSEVQLGAAVKGNVLIHAGVNYEVVEPPLNDGLITTLILRNA